MYGIKNHLLYKWEDKISNENIRKRANVSTIKERMNMLANRYIKNAVFNENELILGLISESCLERKSKLIDVNLADGIILKLEDIIETNKYLIAKPYKHKTVLCEYIVNVLDGLYG